MEFDVMNILMDIAVILLATKLLGMLTRKLGLPQVVGMILAGLLIGPAIFSKLNLGGFQGLIHPTEAEMDVLQSFSQVGVVFILFSSGLETDFGELKKSGLAATAIACAGVLVPIALGTIGALCFMGGFGAAADSDKLLNALFVGCILAATSVGITVETLRELGKLSTRVGTTVLSAAIIDDVIGIIALSLLTGLKGGGNIGLTLLKAVEAGVDVIDTALSALGNGTSQPTTESMVATLQGTEYDTGLDLKLLSELAGYFRGVADELTKEGWRDPARVLSTDANTLIYQVPGGMLSNLIGQLKKANAMDKYYEVLAEVPRVRKDFGYPPLVTPTSQIVGTQAVMNVISGERYKMVPKESKALLRGEYGRLPAEVNEEVRRKCIGDDKVITHRPADDIPPELDKYREEIRDYYQQEEDVLSYALFPQVATKFFQYRQAKQLGVDSTMLNKEEKVMPV